MLPELDEIRKRRAAGGLTQAALAGMAGVPQSVIAKIEAGRTKGPSYPAVKALFEALDRYKGSSSAPVSRIMNRHLLKVAPVDTVRRAIGLMREKDVSQLPVLSSGMAVGSVSERTILDLLRKGESLESVSAKRIEEIMGPAMPVVPQETGADTVSSFLESFPAVLVSSESGAIVGIATKSDLLKTVKK